LTDQGKAGFIRHAKALIYPAETVAGYGLIYSLGIAGVPVAALNAKKCANFSSRYAAEKHVVPDPLKAPEDFVGWLAAYGKKQGEKPVLFLAEDVYAYIVSLYQADLIGLYRYPYISPEKLPVFFNKKYMFRAAREAGIRLPRTEFSPLSDERAAQWDAFPALIKPLVSRFTFEGKRLVDTHGFPRLFGGKAVQVSGPEDIARHVRVLEENKIAFCLQALVPGDNDRIANIKFVADRDGGIPSCFISRKYRQQPADFGTCCVARPDYVEEIHRQAESFCRAAGYAGPGGMEFKQHAGDGRWYFIEVNPRLDFWIRMAVLEGVNLPLQQYLLSTGQGLFSKKQREKGKYWIDVFGDMAGLKWRRNKKDWRLAGRDILRPYLRFNEAVFNARDLYPGFKRFAKNLRKLSPL
jgi:predicted ATP-grasp superfamily ATP-dependent carboligase